MTVHMFRVMVSESGYTPTELQSRIQTWVDSHTKWGGQDSSFSVSLTQGRIEDSTTEYYSGDFRFERTDVKDNILQKLEDSLVNKVEWYRIGYHACTHDESDPSPCSWDSTVEWSDKEYTVPEYVPEMV